MSAFAPRPAGWALRLWSNPITQYVIEARKRPGEILESVYYRGDEIVIERAGKPMAVVIQGNHDRGRAGPRYPHI